MVRVNQKILLGTLQVDRSQDDYLRGLLKQAPDWNALKELAQKHGVLPLCYKRLQSIGRELVPEHILGEFKNLYIANTLRNLKLQKELQKTIELLSGAGIPVIPFKGPTLAEEVYGDVALRQFSDLDILVPRCRAVDAAKTLVQAGYVTDYSKPESRLPTLLKVTNDIPFEAFGSGILIELHWEFFHKRDAYPFVEPEAFQKVNVSGGGVVGKYRLSDEENLVMLCAHGTRHSWEQLKWVIDVAEFVEKKQGLDWEKVLALADCCRARGALLLGVSLGVRTCGCSCPQELETLIETDGRIGSLGDKCIRYAFSDKRLVLDKFLVVLGSRERMLDRVRVLFGRLFCPTRADWLALPLPSGLFFVYVFFRPLRLLLEIWKRGSV